MLPKATSGLADKLLTQLKRSHIMSDTSQCAGKQQAANLEALQEQLEQAAAKVKRSDQPKARMLENVRGPTIVIRGK